MNTKLLVSVCAVAALLAACNKREDAATPDTTTPPAETPPPPVDAPPPAETPPPSDSARRDSADQPATAQLAISAQGHAAVR